MTRKTKYLALFGVGAFILAEAVLGVVLFRVPEDGIGMRPILSKVINTSSAEFFNSPATCAIEGVNPDVLGRLRGKLDTELSTAGSDWEKAKALAGWVRSRLTPGEPTDPATSASVLIDRALAGKHPSCWCDEFAKLYYLCCLSAGVRCRIVHLSARSDAPGALQDHYLNEVWSEAGRSWAVLDPYFGRCFKGASALEIHDALLQGRTDTIEVVQPAGMPPPMELEEYLRAFAHLQVVGGPVFASGSQMLRWGKRVVFYNWVDEKTPPLRTGYEAVFVLGRYVIPSLIALSVLTFVLWWALRKRKALG